MLPLLLLEGGLRLFWTAPPARDGGGIEYATTSPMFAPGAIPPKPPKTKRVAIVGGSVTLYFAQGLPLLKKELSALWPGFEIEFIEAGRPAYDSFREKRVLREVLGYEPDLVILMSGNNEHPWLLEPVPENLYKLNRALARLRIYRWVRSLAPARLPSRAERLKMFEDNLTEMTAMASAAGVPLVLCTMPANLRDFPPSKSAPWDKPGFKAGLAALERGLPADAVKKLEPLAGSDATAAFWLAKAEAKLGRKDAALRNFEFALSGEAEEQRAPAAVNEAVRRAARGGLLADLDAAFRRRAGGMPGNDMFLDGCHWKFVMNPLVVGEIVAALARRKSAAPPAPLCDELLFGHQWRYAVAGAMRSAARSRAQGPDEEAVAAFDGVLNGCKEKAKNILKDPAALPRLLREDMKDEASARFVEARRDEILSLAAEARLREGKP